MYTETYHEFSVTTLLHAVLLNPVASYKSFNEKNSHQLLLRRPTVWA